jgi:sporulation protein YlmC with PRC-barrel domain
VVRTGHTHLVDLRTNRVELSRPWEDVRGMTVVDLLGHLIGEVDDLYVDQEQRRCRALVVRSGGLAGLARTTRVVPIDAVTRVDERVHLGLPHTRVHDAPSAPDLAPTRHYEQICAHYGHRPYWERG